jgi:hypothetical protein
MIWKIGRDVASGSGGADKIQLTHLYMIHIKFYMPKSEKFNQIENNVLFYDFYMSQEDYVWVLESKKQLLSL